MNRTRRPDLWYERGMNASRSSALCLALLVTLAGSHAAARPLSLGVRGGVSLDPDQLVIGGSLLLPGLAAETDGIDFSGLLGIGDHVTTVRASANYYYGFLVSGGDVTVFPLGGLTIQYYSADCPDVPGFEIDCSGTEVGANLGGGAAFGPLRGELWIGVGDVTEIALTGAYFF